MEDRHPMLQPFRFSDTDHLVHERIRELHEIASQLHATTRADPGRAGVVTRARSVIGRRLISFGSAIAGQHA